MGKKKERKEEKKISSQANTERWWSIFLSWGINQ
jgi:hypothetical protein